MENATPTRSWRLGRRPAGRPRFRSKPGPWWDWALKLSIPVLVGASLVISLYAGSLQVYVQLLNSHTYTAFWPALIALYALALLIFQGLRTILWARYKPYPLGGGPLASVTVIIPAYNEGAMVEKSLYSVAAADYPAEMLEIICIDDGSTDDTWSYIQRARERYPHLIKPIRFPRNRGKKEALYAGFSQGRGEILITVDSDSVIETDALRHLVAPLIKEDRMGAVAGNVKVYNRQRSFMGKMQGVRFVNLDYLRASQSLYRTVICTPGSLSAYRRSALLPCLEAWRRQTFLGAPCPHSEDRALTNFILREGYYTYYQRTAVVYTMVPETYRGVCGMYLRWERGNVRESFIQLGYLFTKYRPRYRLMPQVEFVMNLFEFPLTFLGFVMLIVSIAFYPLILVKFLALLGVVSLVNQIYYLRLERDAEFVYGVIYSYYAFFLLPWIYPYAFLTVRNGHWLTR